MIQRTRKALGMVLNVSFLIIYCLLVMVAAAHFVVGGHPAFELVFFVVAGLAWLPGTMFLIRWMNQN